MTRAWAGGVAALVALLGAGTPAAARFGPTVSMPVRVGVDGPGVDACSGYGRPTGLDRHGDNFLAVKARPDLAARRTDKLGPDARFFVCETSRDGRWTGIVYAAAGSSPTDCRVSSPLPTPRPYGGPCRSGWVFSRYVVTVAG